MPSVVTLIASGGEEFTIDSFTLGGACTVWHERLLLAEHPINEALDNIRSHETVSAMEVEAFIGCCTMLSPNPTMPELLSQHFGEPAMRSSVAPDCAHRLAYLTAALSLIEKYDSPGLFVMVAKLAQGHFPECRLSGHDERTHSLVPVSRWLTQAHLDWLIRCQELCGTFDDLAHHELLNVNQVNLIAQVLTTGLQWTATTRFTNGLHFVHGQVEVIDATNPRKPLPSEPIAKNPIKSVRSTSFDSSSSVLHLFLEPLVFDKERLTTKTLHRALSVCMPKCQLHIAGNIEDFSTARGGKTSYLHDAERYARPFFAPTVNVDPPLPSPATPSSDAHE